MLLEQFLEVVVADTSKCFSKFSSALAGDLFQHTTVLTCVGRLVMNALHLPVFLYTGS